MARDARTGAPKMDHDASGPPVRISKDRTMKMSGPAADDRKEPLPAVVRPGRADALRAVLDASLCDYLFRPGGPNTLVFGVALGLSLLAVPFVAGWLMPHMPWPFAVLLAVAIAIAATAAARRWIRLPEAGPDRSFWLALSLCPSCGYAIAKLEPQTDNCRVCPECGSAWKLDDSVEGSAIGRSGEQG